jgi:hypothetical protein
MWRGGCIIRSTFLGKIKEAFDKAPELENLLLDRCGRADRSRFIFPRTHTHTHTRVCQCSFFRAKIEAAQANWRLVACEAVIRGVPAPCILSALTYYDGYRVSLERRGDPRACELTASVLCARRRRVCRRICCKGSATTLARTRLSASTSRAARRFMSSECGVAFGVQRAACSLCLAVGPARVARRARRRTTCEGGVGGVSEFLERVSVRSMRNPWMRFDRRRSRRIQSSFRL